MSSVPIEAVQLPEHQKVTLMIPEGIIEAHATPNHLDDQVIDDGPISYRPLPFETSKIVRVKWNPIGDLPLVS